jgi:hypothetical protein
MGDEVTARLQRRGDGEGRVPDARRPRTSSATPRCRRPRTGSSPPATRRRSARWPAGSSARRWPPSSTPEVFA